MSKHELIAKTLKEMCSETEGSDYEVHFRNDYSGRGMYGRNCVGITGSARACNKVIGEAICHLTNDVIQAFDNLCDESTEAEYRAANQMQSDMHSSIMILMDSSRDNMGYDVIVYWERVESLEEIEEDAVEEA